VTNAPKNKNLEAIKGKDGEEKEKGRPVTRRSRSTVSAPTAAAVEKERASGLPAAKRKATAPPLSRTTTASRSRSTTAHSTHDDGVLKERSLNTEGRAKAEDLDREPAPEPARKKRKTSSPVLAKPEEEEDNEDLADPGVYDEDGQELQLSSGRKGTSLRSPKRATRAKDEGWTDLDAEDEGDPAMVSEYVIDAFNYMMRIEVSLYYHCAVTRY
jgi:G2/mitotic-specific cyclin 1/2